MIKRHKVSDDEDGSLENFKFSAIMNPKWVKI
jgi:hypothetical protein